MGLSTEGSPGSPELCVQKIYLGESYSPSKGFVCVKLECGTAGPLVISMSLYRGWGHPSAEFYFSRCFAVRDVSLQYHSSATYEYGKYKRPVLVHTCVFAGLLVAMSLSSCTPCCG